MSRVIFYTKGSFVNGLLNRALRRILVRRYYNNFYREIDYPPPSKGKVLLYAGIGYMYLTPLEILMYHLLRKEGYDVDYFIYSDSVLAHELTTKKVLLKLGRKKFLRKELKNAVALLTSAKVSFKYIQSSDQVSLLLDPVKNNLQEMLSFEFRGIKFGNIIRGAMYRYYKSIHYSEDALDVAYNYLHTALTNYFQIADMHSKNKYEFALFSHGINCTWEPVAEFCKAEGLRYLCYDRAKRLASANFNVNQPSPVWNFDSAWKRYQDRGLTDVEEKWVDDYLKKREQHTGDVYAYNFVNREADLKKLRSDLGIKEYAKVVTIFTNLIWDAANVSRDIAFKTPLDCIEETLKRYGDDERIHILLRPHPAEKVLGTNDGYAALVKNSFGTNLPSNYTVVDPISVNSFTVIDLTDIGVVNTSTVGLELSMLGKPCILIADTHYRNKGFTIDVTEKEDYFLKIEALINGSIGKLKPESILLARKYFYMMMKLYQKNTPLIIENNVFNGYSYNRFNDVSGDEDIVRIIKSMANSSEEDFIFWD